MGRAAHAFWFAQPVVNTVQTVHVGGYHEAVVDQSQAPNFHRRDIAGNSSDARHAGSGHEHPRAQERAGSAAGGAAYATSDYYSVKMRASLGGLHISGAEVLVESSSADLPAITSQLTNRALTHPKGRADSIAIHTQLIPGSQIQLLPLLEVKEHSTHDVAEATGVMRDLLAGAGVAPLAVETGLKLLHTVTGLRGAMLVDAHTGQRLEMDQQRGVRVSMFGALEPREHLETKRHHQEALLLASKVLATPYVVAEACISDDPDYTTGYLACEGTYHRIFNVKEAGSSQGTRVWFVDLHAGPNGKATQANDKTDHLHGAGQGDTAAPLSKPVHSLSQVVESIQHFAEHQPVLITPNPEKQ